MADHEDTEVGEAQLAEIIYTMLLQANDFIASDSFEEAENELADIEQLMENIKAQGADIDSSLVLLVLKNKAYVALRLDRNVQCTAYLEACVFNLNSELKTVKGTNTKQRLHRLRSRRLLAQTLLQMAVMHSKAGRHQVALDKAREAWRELNYLIKDSLQLCEHQSRAHAKIATSPNSNPQYDLLDSPLYLEAANSVLTAKPVFEYLSSRLLKGTNAAKPALASRSALGVLDYTSLIFTSDISTVSVPQAVPISSLSTSPSLKEEFSQESLVGAVRCR